VSRRETAARNRRDLHERRIAAQPTVLRKIVQAWAWVYAEVKVWSGWNGRWRPKGQPADDVLAAVLAEVTDLAVRLNEEGAKR
jgi:hypothetical protein